jgi:hypothetical protein
LPGFEPPANKGAIASNPSRALVSSINGNSRWAVGISIDGAGARSVTSPFEAAFCPGLEAIESVDIVTNSFDAEQGMAGSAAVSVNIKSGTNRVHGSAFEYHNDNDLMARSFFLPATQNKPKSIHNQFGGTIGGPIKKDKLFYFVSYEGTFENRIANNNGSMYTVPTAAIRQGDMSGSPTLMYDPATGNADGSGRTPFPNNVIPPSRVSSASQKMVSLLPQPTLSNLLVSNYYATGRENNHRHQIDTKVNYNVTNKLRVSGRVSETPWRAFTDTAFGYQGLGGPQLYSSAWTPITYGGVWNASLSTVYTLKPNFLIDGYAGYTVENVTMLSGGPTTKVGVDYLGIPGTEGPRSEDVGWPQFVFSSTYTAYGAPQASLPTLQHFPQFEVGANANWTKGTHNLRFGGEMRREVARVWNGLTDTFTFNGDMTALKGGSSPNQYNIFADFLLGLSSSYTKMVQWVTGDVGMNWFYGLYVRDQWQASRKLTVSYGIRWDYFPAGTRDMVLYSPGDNTLMDCGFFGTPANCGVITSKRLFQPRFGIAYRPSETFVVRAGYGLSYDPINASRDTYYGNYPTMTTYAPTPANSYTPAVSFATGVPAAALVPPNITSGIFSMPLALSLITQSNPYVRAYIQSWNFTMQKELKWGWVAQAGYVASRTIHAMGPTNINGGMVVGAGLAGEPLYQEFGRTAATSIYHPWGNAIYDSLQATMEHRFAAGHLVKLAYTLSKNIGTCCGDLTSGSPSILVPADYNLNRAILPYDIPQKFTALGLAELPFGKGKHWANSGALPTALLSGWQVNGVFAALGGTPFSVSASGASLNTPGSTQRADQVKANVQYLHNVGPGQSWFDPLAFASVTAVRFGTAGFDTLRGPGSVNLDLAVFRQFKLSERVNLQFRAEAFNGTNTPHFSNPNGNVSGMLLNPDGTIKSMGSYSAISGTKGTGHDGLDQRAFLLGLRIGF